MKIKLPIRTDYPKWKVLGRSDEWYFQLTPLPKIEIDLNKYQKNKTEVCSWAKRI